MKKKEMTADEMRRMGGKAVVEQYGSAHMASIAKKGREAAKLKDPDYGKKLSQAGVLARQKKREEKLKKLNSPVNKLANILGGK